MRQSWPRNVGASLRASRRDRIGRAATFALAALVVVLTLSIIVFISAKGLATFTRDGVHPLRFLAGRVWRPDAEPSAGGPQFGILPFLTGSLAVSMLATTFATALSIPTALFLAEIAPRRARQVLQPTIELFAGIPSVVYGWLGLTILVPAVRNHFGGMGFSVLSAGLVLSVMILPTIVTISADSLRTVPRELREGALALGATRWQAVAGVVLPAALPGVLTGLVLGIARAFGETLAVQMVIGNARLIPSSLLAPAATLTTGITMEMGNTVAGSVWNDALGSLALVLLTISLLFILFIRSLGRRGAAR